MVFEVQGFLRMLHSKSIMVTSGWPWSSPNFPLDIIYNPGCHLSDFFHASLIVNLEIYGLLLLLLSLQSCPTLCDPIDGSPPGSPIPGILQARTLEWVAISFSSARKWKVKVKSLSRVRLFMTPWTAAYQAPPPIGFSSEEEALINFLGSQKILSLEIRSLESICKTAHKWLFI